MGWLFANSYDALYYSGGGLFAELCVATVIWCLVTCSPAVLRIPLAAAPLMYVGRISYGLYLWHVPVIHGFSLFPKAYTGWTWWQYDGVVLLTCLVFTLFSYYVIEQPVLAWGRSLIKPPRRERTPAHTPKPASPRA